MRKLIGLGLTARLLPMTFPGFNVQHALEPFASCDWFQAAVPAARCFVGIKSAGTILRKRERADSSSALALSWRSPGVHLNTLISSISQIFTLNAPILGATWVNAPAPPFEIAREQGQRDPCGPRHGCTRRRVMDWTADQQRRGCSKRRPGVT